MDNNPLQPHLSAQQLTRAASALETFIWFATESGYARLAGKAGVNDFALGNPHEMPLPGLVGAFRTWIEPQNQDWFAYKMSEPGAREVVSASLQKRLGISFDPEDIYMTNGAFAAISVALKTVIDPGDEILYISPPWFFYKPIIVSHYGEAIRVPCDPHSYDLDLTAIQRAITPRTRAIIINSPNNPTGKIYPPATLNQLSQILSEASRRFHRPIYLLSDESYSQILFSQHEYHSPSEFYPFTLVLYTYGKVLLAPGQRIGFIAIPTSMPNREKLRGPILTAQLVSGYAFPNALLQHALPDLEKLSIDLQALEKKRNWMVAALSEMGYQLNVPEGTFYLLVHSPIPDDLVFINLLNDENILCLPGSTFEMPGYFRISLTASDEMITNALPGFKRAIEKVQVKYGRSSAEADPKQPISRV